MTCDCIESGKPLEGTTGHTASCNYARRRAEKQALKPVKAPKPIAKVSKKMKVTVSEYSRRKKEFMVGKVCPIYPHLPVEDIHHMRGKVGDLYLNEEYWLAVSRKGHIKIERNPEWAKANGYSLSRLAITDESGKEVDISKYDFQLRIKPFVEPHKI